MILSLKKATPEFFEGVTGGRGQKWLEESAVTKFKIFFKLTDTTEGYHVTLTRLLRVTQLLSDNNCIKIVCIEK